MAESTQVAKREGSTAVTKAESTYSNLQYVTLTRGSFFKQVVASCQGVEERASALLAEFLNLGRRTPRLHECTMESLGYAIIRAANLGLNPAIPNEYWLIPREGKIWVKNEETGRSVEHKVMQAEPQYGYGGLRKLVMRSPEVRDCFSREVCINDVFEPPVDPVSLPKHQIPPFTPRGAVIGYYNVIQKQNGNHLTLMMSVAEVEAHRDRYAQQNQKGEYGSSWSKGRPDREGLTNFDRMGLKTVLRMNCSPRNVTLEAYVWEAFKSDNIDLVRAPVDPARYIPYSEVQDLGPGAPQQRELPASAAERQAIVDTLSGELFGSPKDLQDARETLTRGEGDSQATGTPQHSQAHREPAGQQGASVRAQIEAIILARRGQPETYLDMCAEELGTFNADLSLAQLETILENLRAAQAR